ncbi:tripartite tricarboxylate transporter TctB family protein [Fusobacterium sp. PH5-44]|uniref:tripartite tricarboxylate transporter TctB family protein n=1 Tax=unclassified Fusobacterium TaxID=2648384 RepID=UPI003D1949C2
MKKTNKFMAVIMIYIISSMFFIQSFSMVKDAGLFPRLISGVLIFLNTLYAIEICKEKETVKKNKDEMDRNKLIGIVLFSGIYVIFVKFLGYIITTIFYLPIAMNFLGIKNKKTIIITTVLTVAIIYFCFAIMLNVPIPKGIFGF